MRPSIGLWVWEKDRCEDGDEGRIVTKARRYSIGHVLIKTNDGTRPFNGTLGPLVRAFQAAGINVWSWGYFYGRFPEEEARNFADRSRALGVNAVCVDAEVEFKKKPQAAVRLMDTLRRELEPLTLPIGVSSYYLPKNHPDFPWKEFYSRADFGLPQVYFYQTPPDVALERSLTQHKIYFASGKVLPVGAAYEQATGPASNIRRFIAAAEANGIRQISFWSWQHATDPMWEAFMPPEEV